MVSSGMVGSRVPHLLLVLFLAASLSMGDAWHSSSIDEKPNILFIFADDYGWNDIGYHGSDIRTPHMDALAASGVKLENYYVQPICTPSRSQLMSGRYQIYTGLQHLALSEGQANGLPLNFPTVAEKIRDAGYSTHMIGKWHLGYHTQAHVPTSRGFDTFFGFYTGAEDHFTHSLCYFLDQSICGLDLHNGTAEEGEQPDFGKEGQYSAHMYAEEASRIIASRKDSGQPMFIYLSLQSPHSPVQVPNQYREPYENTDLTELRKSYAGMVAAMDEAIKNVTDALIEADMFDNTVIIFSADNGGDLTAGASNWPLSGQKLSLYEGGIKAVGFVSGNPLERSGEVSKGFMHVSDWYPTLVNLAGGNMEDTEVDGFDVWPMISRGRPSPRTELLLNIDPEWTPYVGTDPYEDRPRLFNPTIRAGLRLGPWKLLTGFPGIQTRTDKNPMEDQIVPLFAMENNSTQNIRLYNIDNDPLEETDLSSSHGWLVRHMLRRLQVYADASVPVSFSPFDPQSSPLLQGGAWRPWL